MKFHCIIDFRRKNCSFHLIAYNHIVAIWRGFFCVTKREVVVLAPALHRLIAMAIKTSLLLGNVVLHFFHGKILNCEVIWLTWRQTFQECLLFPQMFLFQHLGLCLLWFHTVNCFGLWKTCELVMSLYLSLIIKSWKSLWLCFEEELLDVKERALLPGLKQSSEARHFTSRKLLMVLQVRCSRLWSH